MHDRTIDDDGGWVHDELPKVVNCRARGLWDVTALRPGLALATGPRDVNAGECEIWERAQSVAGRIQAVRESARPGGRDPRLVMSLGDEKQSRRGLCRQRMRWTKKYRAVSGVLIADERAYMEAWPNRLQKADGP